MDRQYPKKRFGNQGHNKYYAGNSGFQRNPQNRDVNYYEQNADYVSPESATENYYPPTEDFKSNTVENFSKSQQGERKSQHSEYSRIDKYSIESKPKLYNTKAKIKDRPSYHYGESSQWRKPSSSQTETFQEYREWNNYDVPEDPQSHGWNQDKRSNWNEGSSWHHQNVDYNSSFIPPQPEKDFSDQKFNYGDPYPDPYNPPDQPESNDQYGGQPQYTQGGQDLGHFRRPNEHFKNYDVESIPKDKESYEGDGYGERNLKRKGYNESYLRPEDKKSNVSSWNERHYENYPESSASSLPADNRYGKDYLNRGDNTEKEITPRNQLSKQSYEREQDNLSRSSRATSYGSDQNKSILKRRSNEGVFPVDQDVETIRPGYGADASVEPRSKIFKGSAVFENPYNQGPRKDTFRSELSKQNVDGNSLNEEFGSKVAEVIPTQRPLGSTFEEPTLSANFPSTYSYDKIANSRHAGGALPSEVNTLTRNTQRFSDREPRQNVSDLGRSTNLLSQHPLSGQSNAMVQETFVDQNVSASTNQVVRPNMNASVSNETRPALSKRDPFDSVTDARWLEMRDLLEKSIEEVVIDGRPFQLNLDSSRNLRMYGIEQNVCADKTDWGLKINGVLVYKFGEPVKQIEAFGRTVNIYYHGFLKSFWMNGEKFDLRLNAPPRNILIHGVKHGFQIDSRTMDIIVDSEKICKYGGNPVDVKIGNTLQELSFCGPRKTLLIDNVRRELKLDGKIPFVIIDDKPRGIRFDGKQQTVIINDQSFVVPFDSVQTVEIDGTPGMLKVAFGGPAHEIILDGIWAEVRFDNKPVNVKVQDRVYAVRLPGPIPKVKILDELPIELCETITWKTSERFTPAQRQKKIMQQPMMNQGMQPMGMVNQGMQPMGMMNQGMQPMGMTNPGMQPMGMMNQGMQPMGMMNQGMQPMGMMNQGMQPTGMMNPSMGNVNITPNVLQAINSDVLKASLELITQGIITQVASNLQPTADNSQGNSEHDGAFTTGIVSKQGHQPPNRNQFQ